MKHKHYLVRRRCRMKAICGSINLPYGTLAICEDDFLFTLDGKKLCHVNSQNSRDYFSHNDDGMGALRGNLVQSILDALRDSEDEAWDRVWEDPVCAKFKNPMHEDFWVWDMSFYSAEIDELRYINKLVGGKSNV